MRPRLHHSYTSSGHQNAHHPGGRGPVGMQVLALVLTAQPRARLRQKTRRARRNGEESQKELQARDCLASFTSPWAPNAPHPYLHMSLSPQGARMLEPNTTQPMPPQPHPGQHSVLAWPGPAPPRPPSAHTPRHFTRGTLPALRTLPNPTALAASHAPPLHLS